MRTWCPHSQAKSLSIEPCISYLNPDAKCGNRSGEEIGKRKDLSMDLFKAKKVLKPK
jgi:hypothetical protein